MMKKILKRMFNPESKNMNNDEQQIMEYLILNNALEAVAVDNKTGELLYSFTPKLKEIMPDLYEAHMNSVNLEMLSLWERGYINIDFLLDDPKITLTKKALEIKELEKLSPDELWSINELKRLLRDQ
jgi:hypothetical protein